MTEPSTKDLAAQVTRYELMRSPTADELDDYFAAAMALESRLFDVSTGFAQDFDFDRANDTLEQVITLNQTRRAIADRELAHPDLPADLQARLAAARDDASGFVYVVQGRIYQNYAEEQLTTGDVRGALAHLDQARHCYQDLRDASLPQSEFAKLAGAFAWAKTKFFEANTALQQGKYEVAKEGFRQVDAMCEEILKEIARAAHDPNPRILAMIKDSQREFTAQQQYTQVMLRYSDFFCRVQSGDCEYAVERAGEAVSMYETWLRTAVSDKLSRRVQNLRETELEYFKGWLAWANAEYSLEKTQWSECFGYIKNARRHWFRSSDMALRHALRGVMSPQFETANTEMLLQSTWRRCRSEQELHERIKALRRETQPVGNVFHLSSSSSTGETMNNETSNLNFSGPVNAGSIGGKHNKVTADRIGGDQNVANMADLRVLATELAELRHVIAAGARTDEEKAAVEEIALAEQDARGGDEKGARHHLAAAGRWALSVVEKLALPVAEAAIKASLT
jgi:tetratricopeptide (TPR) repeat protein